MKPSEIWLLLLSDRSERILGDRKLLHKFDTSTTTITAVALMFLPGFAIMSWKEAQPKIPWGTVVLFGVGISRDAGHQCRRHDHAAAVRGELRLHPGGECAANMVAYGTDTFSARDFVRTGRVLTAIALALVMLLAATYWRWLG